MRAVLEATRTRMTYRDLAITPPDEEEFETLGLYTATAGGTGALERMRRLQRPTAAPAAATPAPAPAAAAE